MLSIGVGLNLVMDSSSGGPDGTELYLQPGGADRYLQPDGSALYYQPI